jgi:hypothetical protein
LRTPIIHIFSAAYRRLDTLGCIYESGGLGTVSLLPSIASEFLLLLDYA